MRPFTMVLRGLVVITVVLAWTAASPAPAGCYKCLSNECKEATEGVTGKKFCNADYHCSGSNCYFWNCSTSGSSCQGTGTGGGCNEGSGTPGGCIEYVSITTPNGETIESFNFSVLTTQRFQQSLAPGENPRESFNPAEIAPRVRTCDAG